MSNAVVVITGAGAGAGAGSGIGRAAAQRMVAEHTVVATGRTKAKLERLAGLIQYLCSEAAGFITGEIINHNGGWRFGS
jgi:NAD(P)-dependent dehydrogenase (short-subunit alcohol dehydrogenase family)